MEVADTLNMYGTEINDWDIRIINLWDNPGMNSVSHEDYAKYMADPITPPSRDTANGGALI